MLGADISKCVTPAELKRVAESMGHLLEAYIVEAYSPERVLNLCQKHRLTPGCPLDLTNMFDVDKADSRQNAWETVRHDMPQTVIGGVT